MKQQQIESLRQIDLKQILNFCGCSPHRLDKCKWHTPCGTISLKGQKFMNWSKNKGGGGAIDLVCHLRGDDFKQAVMWLASNFEPSSLPHFGHEIPQYTPTKYLRKINPVFYFRRFYAKAFEFTAQSIKIKVDDFL